MSIEIFKDDNYKKALADLLFPEYKEDAKTIGSQGQEKALLPEDYEAIYPARDLPENAAVTRLGPSPTGFIHLGNLFMAVVNQRLAKQSGGRFFLRIEDTDQKREVEGAVPSLIRSLSFFGIDFDEGVGFVEGSEDALTELGDYGPYYQSERLKIYRSFARKLVLEGKAYPCFLTEDEIEGIRAEQTALKKFPGIYGEYAACRGMDIETITQEIMNDKAFVLRFFADYDGAAHEGETITVEDGIRGSIKMPKNIMDVVILKTDGLPTYHFAHTVDDHLMRTTHVVRGEEWLSSLQIHIALAEALAFKPPTYCHTALLMKVEDGVKRKLSKRKDPELALSYYISEGYHPLATIEYLLTIINSDYEEWRIANPDADNSAFTITTEKMGASGIMFDLEKLRNISRDTLVRIPANELADFMLGWAETEKPEAFAVLSQNRETLELALDIGRSGEKPRKDLCYATQIFEFISYFFDPFFEMEDDLPSGITGDDAKELIEGYLSSYDHADDRELWFGKIRELAVSHGFAAKPKDFKNNPDLYKGHVGDVSAVIRRALTGRINAPDIYEIQQILGETRVRERLEA
jgi:Glutamyl- and glutaminyl-tRNA synthetases